MIYQEIIKFSAIMSNYDYHIDYDYHARGQADDQIQCWTIGHARFF